MGGVCDLEVLLLLLVVLVDPSSDADPGDGMSGGVPFPDGATKPSCSDNSW